MVRYCKQDVRLLGTQTVRESLAFNVSMRFVSLTRRDVDTRVAKVIGRLGLMSTADKAVSTLSGGQFRRLVLAMELVRPTQLLQAVSMQPRSLPLLPSFPLAALLC